MDEQTAVIRTVRSGTAKLMPDLDRPGGLLLTVDGAPQSYVDPDDPLHLEFEYTRRLAHLLDVVPGRPVPAPLDVLHLGGGALTLPRYLAATRPGSRQHVAEADDALLDLVTERLPLPPGAGITLHAEDALSVLRAAPAASADVVVADVFGGSRIPAHLTTLTCARAAARVLRPEGVHAVNLADAAPFAFLGSQLATLGAVFDRLCLVAEPSVLRGRRFGNILVAASRAALPVADLARRTAADAFPARVEHGSSLLRFSRGVPPVQEGEEVPSPAPPGGAFSIG